MRFARVPSPQESFMYRKWFSIAALVTSATLLLSVSSCGHSRQLVSITVMPQGSSFNLTGFGQTLSTQFTAIGTYIHPPQSRDITTTAVWKSDTPDVVTLDPKQPGLVTTTGTAC